MDLDSGVIACDTLADKVERCARHVHRHAKQDPDHPKPAPDVLRGLVGDDAIELVDVGVPEGRAVVEFRSVRGGKHEVSRVVILYRQRCELITLACADACAQIMAQARSETWSDPFLCAVAAAIAMPAAPFLRACHAADVESAARIYKVDEDLAHERYAFLRSKGTSGERHAISR